MRGGLWTPDCIMYHIVKYNINMMYIRLYFLIHMLMATKHLFEESSISIAEKQQIEKFLKGRGWFIGWFIAAQCSLRFELKTVDYLRGIKYLYFTSFYFTLLCSQACALATRQYNKTLHPLDRVKPIVWNEIQLLTCCLLLQSDWSSSEECTSRVFFVHWKFLKQPTVASHTVFSCT